MWYNLDMRGFLRKVSCVVLAIIFAGLSPVSTFALSSSQLNMFSQNNILFYNPDDGCKVTPNDIYKGAQYSLTDEEIAGFARAADNENNCNLNAIKSELSIMANLFEANGSDSSSIILQKSLFLSFPQILASMASFSDCFVEIVLS